MLLDYIIIIILCHYEFNFNVVTSAILLFFAFTELVFLKDNNVENQFSVKQNNGEIDRDRKSVHLCV